MESGKAIPANPFIYACVIVSVSAFLPRTGGYGHLERGLSPQLSADNPSVRQREGLHLGFDNLHDFNESMICHRSGRLTAALFWLVSLILLTTRARFV